MTTEADTLQYVPDEFDGLTLKDVTPQLEKAWWRYPKLLQLYLLLLCAFLGQFTTGFDGSMLNGMQSLPQWNKDFGYPTGGRLGAMVNGVVFGVLASLFVSSQLCDKLGRRYPITIGSSLVVLGSALQAAAQTYAMFVVGRFFIGIGGGIVAVAAPQLMTECAFPSHRGKLVSLYMTQWPVGYLVAAWTTYGTFQLNSSWSWRIPGILQCVPSLIQVVLSLFAPESPRWLIYNDRMDEAIDMLATYHANGDRNSRLVRFQVAEIQATIIEEKKEKAIQWAEFIRTKGNRHRLFILLFIGYMVQMSGLGLTGYYLPKILDTVNITSAKSQLLINAVISIWQLGCSIFFAMMIDRAGRRTLIIFGTIVMFVVFVIWTIASAIMEEQDFKNRKLAALVVAMLFLFQVGYQPVGVASIPYVMEVSLYSLRSKTAMIFQGCGYTASVYNGFVNPIAMETITWRYYIFGIVILAVEIVLSYLYLPETKAKGLEEIGEIFDGDELLTGVQAMQKHKKEYMEAMKKGDITTQQVEQVQVVDERKDV